MYKLSSKQQVAGSKGFFLILNFFVDFDVFVTLKRLFFVWKNVCISFGKLVVKTMNVVHNLCTKFSPYNPCYLLRFNAFFIHFSYPAFTTYTPQFAYVIFGLEPIIKNFIHISPPFNNNNHLNINIKRI